MPLKKAKHGFLDLRHPFFEPVPIRLATVAVCFGWGLIEFSAGAAFWGTMFCAVGAVAVYQFFLSGHFGQENQDDS